MLLRFETTAHQRKIEAKFRIFFTPCKIRGCINEIIWVNFFRATRKSQSLGIAEPSLRYNNNNIIIIIMFVYFSCSQNATTNQHRSHIVGQPKYLFSSCSQIQCVQCALTLRYIPGGTVKTIYKDVDRWSVYQTVRTFSGVRFSLEFQLNIFTLVR